MKQIGPVLLLLAMLMVAGCVTPPVDWQSRVGKYTQEQAVSDLGPPEKSTKLSDGSIVDEWLVERAHTIVAPEPYFMDRSAYFGPATPNYSETDVPNYFLQLTFGADGQLKAWKKFAR